MNLGKNGALCCCRKWINGIALLTFGFVSGGAEAQLAIKQKMLLQDFNLKAPHVPSELIVKYNSSIKNLDKFIAKSIESKGFKNVWFKNASIKSKIRGTSIVVLKFPQSKSKEDLYKIAKILNADPNIQYVEANQIVRMLGAKSFGKKSKLPLIAPIRKRLKGEELPPVYGQERVNAPDAWEITKGSKDILVSVVDTGIDLKHADLKENIWKNPGEVGTDENGLDKSTNGIDDDNNGYVDDVNGWDFVNSDNDPSDDNGHGTHCAGIIGARHGDGFGIDGIAPEVSLIGIKFLDAGGSGQLEHALAAIHYANSIGGKISSHSWGGGEHSPSIKEAIYEGIKKDILFVAAAGNYGWNNDETPMYPASYDLPNIVSVAASDINDELAFFSNFGLKNVDISAPGVDIVSDFPDNQLESFSGTSMAAPHVSGVAVLVKANNPDWNLFKIKKRLVNSVDMIDGLAQKTAFGGRLNAYNAVENDQIAPSKVTGIEVVHREPTSVHLKWNQSGDDMDSGVATRYLFKISDNPLSNEQAWDQATRIRPHTISNKADQTVTAVINGLAVNSSGYITIRALDNVGNMGELSKSQFIAVERVVMAYELSTEDTTGVQFEDDWAVEQIDGRSVFSDSPDFTYKPNSNSSMVLPVFDSAGKRVVLEFSTKYFFEARFDYGYLEVSHDSGKNWIRLMEVTGTLEQWERKFVPIPASSEPSETKFQIRFKVKSDHSFEFDGWYLDAIKLHVAK